MNATKIEQVRCTKCHALIRFDDENPKGDGTMGNRPKQADLLLGREKTGVMRRGQFRGAATWEFECAGCLNGVGFGGHD
jgi:hypothetical protein